MPLAPAVTLPARAGEQIAMVLAAHGVPDPIIAAERVQMRTWCIAPTGNHIVVADAWRGDHIGLLELARRLAVLVAGDTQRRAPGGAREPSGSQQVWILTIACEE